MPNGSAPSVALAITVLVSFAAASSSSQETAWERYVSEPSPENAETVTGREYSEPRSPSDQEWDLILLEVQVLSADRQAVRLALRLIPQSDADVTETLCIMLGRLIRVDPSMFLREVSGSPEVLVRLGLACLVGSLGPPYVDRFRAQIYETQQRIRALESARVDPELEDLRSACIEILKKEVESLQGLPSERLEGGSSKGDAEP